MSVTVGDYSMSKPITFAMLTAAAVAMAGLAMAGLTSAFAAELLPSTGVQLRHRHATPACDPCGCLHVSYIYHRELRSTYGIGFDPRNYDQTEPHFYFGRMRAYPRYWVLADPAQ
jgi:hypothetical protein